MSNRIRPGHLSGYPASLQTLQQCLVGGHPATQSRSVSGDQTAPDTVLADVPVLQG